MTIKEIEQNIIEEFACYEEWLDKYAYIIELGKECPEIDPADKTENNLIRGCQSRVWLSCRHEDGRLWFKADSDAVITKGRPSFYRRDRTERAPLPYPFERIDVDGETDETVCSGLFATGQGQSMTHQTRMGTSLPNKNNTQPWNPTKKP